MSKTLDNSSDLQVDILELIFAPTTHSSNYAIAHLQPTEGAWAEAKAKAELGLLRESRLRL